MGDQLHQRRQVVADRRGQRQAGDDFAQAVQFNTWQVWGLVFPDQSEQCSQWLLEFIEIIGEVGIQLVPLRDEVDVFQPPGQVFDVLEPELIINREVIAVNGREEIGNGRAQALFVERGDAGLPGRVVGEVFGVTLAQCQVHL